MHLPFVAAKIQMFERESKGSVSVGCFRALRVLEILPKTTGFYFRFSLCYCQVKNLTPLRALVWTSVRKYAQGLLVITVILPHLVTF